MRWKNLKDAPHKERLLRRLTPKSRIAAGNFISGCNLSLTKIHSYNFSGIAFEAWPLQPHMAQRLMPAMQQQTAVHHRSNLFARLIGQFNIENYLKEVPNEY